MVKYLHLVKDTWMTHAGAWLVNPDFSSSMQTVFQ